MLDRKITNAIRFVLDELLPPIIRDNKYFMYPLFFIWYKGGNKVKKMMNLKSEFHKLDAAAYATYYEGEGYISNRLTDLSEKSISFIISNLFEQNCKIADIGCGKGYLLKRLFDAGYHNVVGVDLIPSSLYEDIKIIGGNIENLPFADNSFDIVICNHTLEHVLNLSNAVSELKRIAKFRLIITVPKQRYYHYTLDEHINFFPEISYLLKILGMQNEKVFYKNLCGDWTVVCDMKQKEILK